MKEVESLNNSNTIIEVNKDIIPCMKEHRKHRDCLDLFAAIDNAGNKHRYSNGNSLCYLDDIYLGN